MRNGVPLVLASVHVLGAVAAGPVIIPVSGDVQKVPGRWDTVLTPVSEAALPHDASGSLQITPGRAVQVAEAQLGLNDNDIDQSAGVVRAVLSDRGGQPTLQNDAVWIVVANIDAMSQGPAGSAHFITHKMCIVINAATGEFQEAYAAGPKTFLN
jgi:hypothetical protein